MAEEWVVTNTIDIPKSSTEIIRVSNKTYNDTQLVGVRVWFKEYATDDDYKPTKKGIITTKGTWKNVIPKVIQSLGEDYRDELIQELEEQNDET